MKAKERQEAFLQKIGVEYSEKDNVFPKPMTDSQALEVLCEYFLGKDWYTVDPVGHNQVNVYRVCDIIGRYKVGGKGL